ncbi:MAG TPA: hypothetical protein VM802_10110 [Chitinophaga sp.]|uniref:hypothetical protein n=1 Tax=Chitinophaga sp. TaxID=1869181 RepID=UPI002C60F434|nr:hypothetical protein [Chitinophaga sp.]HVI45216.1 hypothetical protein [Chitinophaga sp.]
MIDRSFWKGVDTGQLEVTHLFALSRAAEDVMGAQTRLIELLEKDKLPILSATEALTTNCLIYRQLIAFILMKIRRTGKNQ